MTPIMQKTYGTMYYVTDMKKSVAYYKENFGLTPRFESEDWTEFEINGQALCLHATNEQNKTAINGIMVATVTNIQQTVKDLKAKGVEFAGEIREIHPGAYCVDFTDPSGNRVDLYEDTNKY